MNNCKQTGSVLAVALMVVAIMALLSATAWGIASSQTKFIDAHVNSENAYYHAEQGLNQYLWKLNDDPVFFLDESKYQEVESTSTFSAYQAKTEDDPYYKVQITIPKISISGVNIMANNQAAIRSTGWSASSPGKKRTIEAQVTRRTFTQYGMVNNTDVNEYGDPLYWVDDEVCYGPYHTNSTLYIGSYSPVFYGPVSYTAGVEITPVYRISDINIFRQGISQTDILEFPASNNDLLAHARINGDYYSGRTCIYLKGDSYDVRYWDMDENNWKYNDFAYTYDDREGPWYDPNYYRHREIGTYYVPSTKTTYNSFASLRADIPSLPLPANGVIYVNGNYGEDGNGGREYEYKYDRNYGNVFVSGVLDGELTIASSNDIFITGYDPCDWRYPTYVKEDKNAQTEGLTYSSTSFHQVFNGSDWVKTEVVGEGDDMLGLAATRFMRIAHYNWPSQEEDRRYNWGGSSLSNRIDIAPNNITIHAALFVKDLSFGFEYATTGWDKGDISLVGSITQNKRGFVGTTAFDGYKKIYSHDPRMLYTSPPHFVEPANIGWQLANWRETSNHI